MNAAPPLAASLNACWAGCILIVAFAMVATRQVQGVVRYYVIQSALLALAAFTLGWGLRLWDLWALGGITIAEKVIIIPLVLRAQLPAESNQRREVAQAVNVPASLLISLVLAITAAVVLAPLAAATGPLVRVNLPIGLGCVLIGAYTVVARREAIPQLIGILAMENGAFCAGIAIAPRLPMIAELALALDVILIAAVAGLLTRDVRSTLGTTAAGGLHELHEEVPRWR
ncbi:MAG: hypothetical protein ACRD04_05005 [Terriglobales bacterium]